MIYVDEKDPVDELELSFPYREIRIKTNVNPEDHYEIRKEELGRGKFGTVFLAEDRESKLALAAKFISCPKKKDRQNVEREIEIMGKLQHPRLLQIYDAFCYDGGSTYCVVLELITGGELFERVIDDEFVLTEKACTVFMRQICEGVDFIHSSNILHLDLKPENILCLTKTGNRIKIIDFGLAVFFDPQKKLQVLFGTPEFAAPEVVNFEPIGCYTDMWSIGVICYVLLSGLSPFMGNDDIQTMTNVTLGQYDFDDETFDHVSADAKDFIRRLLIKDGPNRPTAKDALKHPWLIASAHNTELSLTKSKLKRYVIRKRWIKAVITIIALHRMGAKINFDLV